MMFQARAMLILALALTAPPAAAFDIHDVRYFRETGSRSCRDCDLWEANLAGAALIGAQLQGANLSSAYLERAYLSSANLERARLVQANLQGANLGDAHLQGALLLHAQLQGAFLGSANLEGAYLREANVANAQLSYANLSNAIYAPASRPPGHVAALEGLSSIHIPEPSQLIGLVQLGKLLQEAGLPEEREATYAIERNKTRHLLFRAADEDEQDTPLNKRSAGVSRSS